MLLVSFMISKPKVFIKLYPIHIELLNNFSSWYKSLKCFNFRVNPALNLFIFFKITETKMNLARMMHVLEIAITKARINLTYLTGKYSPSVNDFAEKQFSHL